MNVLIIDGHPDEGRLLSHLLDHYEGALTGAVAVTRFAVRDLSFDPVLHRGYSADQPWEPDIERVAEAIDACDHLVVGFPLWWGAEPAALKGLMDRLLLPGFSFRYHREDVFWDRLLAGRSADVIITMDTPPWYLRWIYGDPVIRRLKHQVLGFCGFKPLRFLKLGVTRRGGAARQLDAWRREVARAAISAGGLKRGSKRITLTGRQHFADAIRERQS
ncbi:NAD(P)H-dependent oxidoreductase [Rhizobium terrae]|uniref:NAD(P)H-dependent oxidoreductase n=1 Tax=Rhizobium terrae TaxID=2171756 RepID=UPI000E3C7D4E|nr:NAD(P)H-dependent oxidoreductase [Rhizobium terrae]